MSNILEFTLMPGKNRFNLHIYPLRGVTILERVPIKISNKSIPLQAGAQDLDCMLSPKTGHVEWGKWGYKIKQTQHKLST